VLAYLTAMITPLHTAPTGGLAPYLDGLNPAQTEAVLNADGPVLVLAGAGTGKTKALTARLAHIIATRRAFPGEILSVTFTNKAAREMQHRVAKLIGDVAQGLNWLGTFHSVAAKMLRRHAELVGLKSSFTILDMDDQLRLIKQVFKLNDIDDKRWPPRVFAQHIDRWKNRGLTPSQLPTGEELVFADGRACELYQAYQDRLLQLNACDFGDLLLHLLTIFTSHPQILGEWQRRFKYILVDEYQDTNTCQYLWLRLLAQRGPGLPAHICCVGDDDQSIYGWRGAEIGNILKFESDFPGAQVIRLEQNYRSTAHILGAASGLIAQNESRWGKTLWTQAQGGERVSIISVWDGAEEARMVGERVERSVSDGGRLTEIAVLVRATFQTREFEDRFITLGIPYKIVGGFRFYERAEIRDALAYLRIVQSPSDDLAFERIVNTPKRGLGDKSLQKLFNLARSRRISLFESALSLGATDDLPTAARRTLGQLAQDFARWRKQSLEISHTELIGIILEESGYVAMLQNDKSPEAAGRIENLSELVRAMEEFENLSGFLEHVSLVMDNEANDSVDKITVMTMHAAKGLEFNAVFLVGWEDGIFPSQRSMDENGLTGLEEERRLAYVGITRAKHKSFIFHAANRRVYGQWQSSMPSRFIAELPKNHVEMETTISSGNHTMWRSQSGGDPFGNIERGNGRGPGWARAAAQTIEGRAVSAYPTPNSSHFKCGDRVFHQKFGYGLVKDIEGDKLEIDFDVSGTKHVVDSFVSAA
jgi:DNA helicase II / ATP-dependent DNA helicase PcrA